MTRPAELLYTGTPEEIAKKLRAGTESSVNGCFNNTGRIFGFDADGRKDLLYHLGTSTAVRDIDTLRSIMGATKLDYVATPTVPAWVTSTCRPSRLTLAASCLTV